MLLDRLQAWEFSLLALCIWREARGEPYQGKLGVAWVIRNRALHPSWYGHDWEEIILKPSQFSSFNPNDPNAVKFPGDPAKEPDWAECLSVAQDVYSNAIADPTGGAINYHAISAHPDWADKMNFTVQLGNHRFYTVA